MLDEDQIKHEQFDPNLMDSYPTFNSIPLPTDMFGTAQQDFKYEMLRSVSQSSFQQIHAETAPSLLSSASVPSLPSASSSTVGSPQSGFAQPVSNQYIYANQFNAQPTIICDDSYPYAYESSHFDHEAALGQEGKINVPFVDPVLISAQQPPYLNATYGAYQVPGQPQASPAASPAPSTYSLHSFSAPVTIENFDQQHAAMRRQSICSLRSGASPRSTYSNDEESGKGRCPYPDCGRVIKDLKAHMMTHEMVRPEKCPIPSCEYHTKGFARKYDKNRHTLTHYRGTMVCGFCPGSGSAAEKSFNRADVFKRHLTTVHGVEQTPPNSRKRSPSRPTVSLSSYCQDATGKCSTCGASFNNAQDFYEHLDDCVLKVVQQEEPSEAVNARRLGEVANDQDVQATLERNNIKLEDSPGELEEEDDEDDEEEDEDEEEFDFNERSGRGVIKTTKATSNRPIIGGNVCKKSSKKGLTWSKGGGSIIGKSRKRRKFYPPSWGMATEKMNMKKRVLCVYDGQRRLLKDDIMMHNEFEVRMPLQDGNNYVTDLDLETVKRAEAFHNLSDADKGPWIQEQDFLQEFLE